MSRSIGTCSSKADPLLARSPCSSPPPTVPGSPPGRLRPRPSDSAPRRSVDRAGRFAIVAAREAVADSGLLDSSDLPKDRIATAVGNAVGCTTTLEREFVVLSDGGQKYELDQEYAIPELYWNYLPNPMAAEVGRDIGAEGPAAVVSTGCTSGIDVLGHAAELIRESTADAVIAGATEAPISPSPPPASTRSADHRQRPARSGLPSLRSDRRGLVLGEGRSG